MTRAEFAEKCLIYCAWLGASEVSGYRTATRNGVVGGVNFSAHQAGLARDVVYDAPVGVERRQEIGRRLGLKVIVEDDHDHLQPHDWVPG